MELVGSVASIILINLVLSGDNAVVIGMAAHRLPQHQRQWAILVGAGGAIALRVVLTAVAAMLLEIPLLKLVGGAALMWIAYTLLEVEDESSKRAASSSSLRHAIRTIIIADLVMSIDNILGVAAAARGDVSLLVFGLILSMIIVMVGGGAIAGLIDRFWWLEYVGSGVIAWTGTEIVLSDPLVAAHVGDLGWFAYALQAAVTMLVLGAAHYAYRYRPAQIRSAREPDGAGD